MDPVNCLLTSLAGAGGSDNITGDPNVVETYQNDIVTAGEPAEGGNFIDTNFSPLTLVGDYHIQIGAATNTASGDLVGSIVELLRDIDNDIRPFADIPDIGADEVTELPLIIDNGDPGTGFTLDWLISGAANPYDSNSLYSRTAGATYSYEGARQSRNSVWLWWTNWASRSSSVQV